MARPVQVDGRQTRQAILDAALALFAEKGYFGTSLREIAAAVGVRESALYNYFASKDALFIALLDMTRQSAEEQLASLAAEPIADLRSFLEDLTARILEWFVEPQQQQVFRVFMADGMRLAREGRLNLIERLMNCPRHFHVLMAQLIRDGGLAWANPEQLAVEFMGPLLLWRHLHALTPDDPLIVNRRRFVRSHVNQFLGGAERQPSGRRSSKAAPVAARTSKGTARPRSRVRIAS